MSEHFVAIIPRHLRILGALIEQRKRDAFGAIGWRALLDESESRMSQAVVMEVFAPLLMRGLIEDLSKTPLGYGGTYFVRITPLGQLCYGFGYMLKVARPSTEEEYRKFCPELLPKPAFTNKMPAFNNESYIEGTA